MRHKTNVLFIMTDQHNYQSLGCYGNKKIKTPHIDSLSEQGVVFENAYCPSPICGPSRASIFTGLYSQCNGVVDNQMPVRKDLSLLPDCLQENGYHTAMIGKLHLSPGSDSHGFNYKRLHDAMYDVYNAHEPWESDYVAWLANTTYGGDIRKVIEMANSDEVSGFNDVQRFLLGSNWRSENEHSNTWVAQEAVEYIKNHSKRPFFLFVSFFGPHHPMKAPKPWGDVYNEEDVDLPAEFYVSTDHKPVAKTDPKRKIFGKLRWDEKKYKEIIAAYYGQISMIDHGIGGILSELKKQHLSDNTYIIFAADHGDMAGQFGWFFKNNMYEGSVHVPLIISDPDYAGSAGLRSDTIVNLIDLYKTILVRCGIAQKHKTHSRDISELIAKPTGCHRQNSTYSEFLPLNGPAYFMAIQDKYKIISAEQNGNVIYELYRIDERPADARNLWHDDSFGPVKRQMRQFLNKQKKRASAIH